MPIKAVLYSLPYFNFSDSAEIFTPFANDKWAIFLDSGRPRSTQGRYDIISANPVCTLVTHGETTLITTKADVIKSNVNPFELLKTELTRYGDIFDTSHITEFDLPFVGGAIGYFAYDLARRLENLPTIAKDEEAIPDMAVGIYNWAFIIDHQTEQSFLLCQDDETEKVHRHSVKIT